MTIYSAKSTLHSSAAETEHMYISITVPEHTCDELCYLLPVNNTNINKSLDLSPEYALIDKMADFLDLPGKKNLMYVLKIH